MFVYSVPFSFNPIIIFLNVFSLVTVQHKYLYRTAFRFCFFPHYNAAEEIRKSQISGQTGHQIKETKENNPKSTSDI